MTEIAKSAGLGRESLYKALRPNSQPRMETMTRVLGALGVRLVAEVVGAGKVDVVEGVAMDTLTAKPAAKKAVAGKARLRGKATLV